MLLLQCSHLRKYLFLYYTTLSRTQKYMYLKNKKKVKNAKKFFFQCMVSIQNKNWGNTEPYIKKMIFNI